MSATLITQAQYKSVIGTNPSYFIYGGAYPVEEVSWFDAVLFCNALSRLSGMDTVYSYLGDTIAMNLPATVVIDYTRNGYRLPTEAEYEYACRAGTTTEYYWGRNYPPLTSADTLALDSNAIWNIDSPSGTEPVGSKKPNAWGLYDMAGNLWEWCNDWYAGYADSSQTNPTGPSSPGPNNYRVRRGGAWAFSTGGDAANLTAGYRYYDGPSIRNNTVGFRVVIGVR
jgi:formylglycine-generating enzyme required for sulfatase activity